MSDKKSRDTHTHAAVFAAAASRMRPALLATAMGYLHDAEDADDAVQEALMRCWMVRSRMHDLESDLPPMMQTVVRNVCIDYLRLRKHNISIDETSETSPDGSIVNSQLSVVNSPSSPDRLLMEKEAIERMEHCIKRLPPMRRTVIEMKGIDGLSYEEMADMLGTTEAAVRAKVAKARKQLKEMYYKRPSPQPSPSMGREHLTEK